MKVRTYGQIAAAFFTMKEIERGEEMNLGVDEESTIYKGTVGSMPHAIAMEVAPLHPNFMDYYADELMTLYDFPGGGTEDAVMALQIPKRHIYVVIWSATNSEVATAVKRATRAR